MDIKWVLSMGDIKQNISKGSSPSNSFQKLNECRYLQIVRMNISFSQFCAIFAYILFGPRRESVRLIRLGKVYRIRQ